MARRELIDMSNRSLLVVAALGGPLVVAAAVAPFRADVANTNAALLLVVVVVAVAAGGDRLAGVLSAVAAGLWFDILLTQPYGRLSIEDSADIETTALLLIVGVAVTELAVWGRRQQARASRAEGYTEGIQDAVESVTEGAPPAVVIDQVSRQLTRVLHVDRCRFDYGAGRVGGSHPRLRSDGQVEVNGVVCDVERFGLPRDADIEILLVSAGRYQGRFVLTAGQASRPSLAQRLVAVTLANRATAALEDRTEREAWER
jgi:hypothetical protein